MRAILDFEDVLAGPEPAPAAGDPLVERLRICAKLLTVAADETEALRRGDAVRRRELAGMRDALLRELLPAPEGSEEEESGVPTPGSMDVAQILVDALAALDLRGVEEREVLDRWSALEEDALRAMQVGGRITSLRAGRYQPGNPIDARLDVRF